MKCIPLLLVALLCNATLMYSQSTIKGTINDDSGQPLAGVNVIEKGTTNGSASDFDGNYTIRCAPGDVLVFSYVGLLSQEITVGSQNAINVVMQEVLIGSDRPSDISGTKIFGVLGFIQIYPASYLFVIKNQKKVLTTIA